MTICYCKHVDGSTTAYRVSGFKHVYIDLAGIHVILGQYRIKHTRLNTTLDELHSWFYLRRGERKRRATRLWNGLDEIFPNPAFSLCAPLVLEKVDAENSSQGVCCLACYTVVTDWLQTPSPKRQLVLKEVDRLDCV